MQWSTTELSLKRKKTGLVACLADQKSSASVHPASRRQQRMAFHRRHIQMLPEIERRGASTPTRRQYGDRLRQHLEAFWTSNDVIVHRQLRHCDFPTVKICWRIIRSITLVSKSLRFQRFVKINRSTTFNSSLTCFRAVLKYVFIFVISINANKKSELPLLMKLLDLQVDVMKSNYLKLKFSYDHSSGYNP